MLRSNKLILSFQAKISFVELLKEQNLNENSSWSEIKSIIRDDSRYKALESNSTKETIFREFISRLGQNSNVDLEKEISETLKEKERKERIEASLRDREMEVHKELSANFRERDREREQHLHAETVECFNALLIDLVRHPETTWKETKKVLKMDHRWDMVQTLSRSEREDLFVRHIAQLNKKKRDKFREMLNELKDLELTSEWRDIRRLIKDDVRYLKFSDSDRKCEREFNIFMQEQLDKAKHEFKTLLKETKLITPKTKKVIEESEQHLTDIINVLQNDSRYLVLEEFADDRRLILINYISELHRSGSGK